MTQEGDAPKTLRARDVVVARLVERERRPTVEMPVLTMREIVDQGARS